MTRTKNYSLKIYFVGTFPPPVHGMSFINHELAERLKTGKRQIEIINLSFNSLTPKLTNKFARIFVVLKGFLYFLFSLATHRKKILYISLSGGLGKIHEILFVIAAGLFKAPVFIHHHSFLYLNKKSFLLKLIVLITPKSTVHICLCSSMEKELKSMYPKINKILLLSNIQFILPNKPPKRKNVLNTIGFLSNISKEKGIIEFIETCKLLHRSQLEFNAVIAGPFVSTQIEKIVYKEVAPIAHMIKIAGPVYGNDKFEFFKSIDALLFPSHNEAEPVTIWEALANGIPVISTNIGCIKDMIPSTRTLVDNKEEFAKVASDLLLEWRKRPGDFIEMQELTTRYFMQKSTVNKMQLNTLQCEIRDSGVQN